MVSGQWREWLLSPRTCRREEVGLYYTGRQNDSDEFFFFENVLSVFPFTPGTEFITGVMTV
jgi:hypothetical protein